MGQIGLSLTEAGLSILRGSKHAIAFSRDRPWQARSALADSDGRLDEIERLLRSQGYVDVVVTLNADGLEYDSEIDNSITFNLTPETYSDAVQKGRRVLASFASSEVMDRDAAAARFESMVNLGPAVLRPELSVRVTRAGIERLAVANEVRNLRSEAFVDQRPLVFDQSVFERAAKDGSAEVIVTLRNGLAGGRLSKASFDAMTKANKRAFDRVFSRAGLQSPMSDISVFGVMSGRISAGELSTLRSLNDRRLLSVELNRPFAQATLSQSTSSNSTNIVTAWNAGYKGAGQYIIVMDTGVKKDHQFFQKSTGGSKVVYEACFGSNSLGSDGVTMYESVCPNQNVITGDSPLDNQSGYAAPVANCASPTGGRTGDCHHGTHVAGIAAGRNSSGLPVGLQGVANEADIVAVQVFSFDRARVQPPEAFLDDLL